MDHPREPAPDPTPHPGQALGSAKAAPPPGEGADGAPGASRRAFLAQAGATAAVAWFWLEGVGNPLRRLGVEPTLPGAPRRSLDEREWATLRAALDRLLPSSPDTPGARDVNAIGYLDAVLVAPGLDEDAPRRVRAFASRLHEHARAREVTGYEVLPAAEQDAGIRLFEAVEVDPETLVDRRSLRTMISLCLEALLGDPVHGGNLDEIGWRWARHRPGLPRPSKRRRPR